MGGVMVVRRYVQLNSPDSITKNQAASIKVAITNVTGQLQMEINRIQSRRNSFFSWYYDSKIDRSKVAKLEQLQARFNQAQAMVTFLELAVRRTEGELINETDLNDEWDKCHKEEQNLLDSLDERSPEPSLDSKMKIMLAFIANNLKKEFSTVYANDRQSGLLNKLINGSYTTTQDNLRQIKWSRQNKAVWLTHYPAYDVGSIPTNSQPRT